jgi:hypothetical protein
MTSKKTMLKWAQRIDPTIGTIPCDKMTEEQIDYETKVFALLTELDEIVGHLAAPKIQAALRNAAKKLKQRGRKQ